MLQAIFDKPAVYQHATDRHANPFRATTVHRSGVRDLPKGTNIKDPEVARLCTNIVLERLVQVSAGGLGGEIEAGTFRGRLGTMPTDLERCAAMVVGLLVPKLGIKPALLLGPPSEMSFDFRFPLIP